MLTLSCANISALVKIFPRVEVIFTTDTPANVPSTSELLPFLVTVFNFQTTLRQSFEILQKLNRRQIRRVSINCFDANKQGFTMVNRGWWYSLISKLSVKEEVNVNKNSCLATVNKQPKKEEEEEEEETISGT